MSFAAGADDGARSFKIVGGVDAERNVVNKADIDSHAGFERTELFKAFADLERRWRECDKSLQGGAAIGVKADVMIKRPLTRGRGCAGEIERAERIRPDGCSDGFDDVGICAFLGT
jgi:hypothetical protein